MGDLSLDAIEAISDVGGHMENGDGLREQLAALHSISVEIAGLHELSEIHDRALG